MMPWQPYYTGKGEAPIPSVKLPEPPPWRQLSGNLYPRVFQPPTGLVEAVNASIHLRRPLLVTGAPGSGKSTVIDSIAAELVLGAPLRWHITSRSALSDALYRYDVLGRIHAQQLGNQSPNDIADFLQLGPLGTALLPHDRPRALLIDEFDKSDFDLPGDLLEVLERGEFEIQELARHKERVVEVREWAGARRHRVEQGKVRCTSFPVIIITSNGEREFPAPFLRRTVRFTMPRPSVDFLRKVVAAHLGGQVVESDSAGAAIADFVARLERGDRLALDQLLSAVFLMTGEYAPKGTQRARLQDLIMRDLAGGESQGLRQEQLDAP